MATNTAASFTNHTGNATAGPFSISFSYLSEDEIDVTVGGVLKTKTTHYTFPSATTISFTSGNHPGNGVAIKFQRDTDISSKKVDFQDGSVLTEVDLDNNSDQVIFAQQEIIDKLNGIEEGATADQTNAEIRALVESATDSNVFTDADHSKLNAIEASATADQTASEIRTLVENASDSNVFTDADHSKLNAIEASATADQTAAEIRTLVESATDSNVFTDADHTKLNSAATLTDTQTLTNKTLTTPVINDLSGTAVVTSGTSTSDNKIYSAKRAGEIFYGKDTVGEIQSGETWSSSDDKVATTAAIDARVIDLVDDVGGFVPIANETSFPNANPDVNNGAGTLVSIKALSQNLTSNGSGQISVSNGTVGNSTVTITGATASTTFAAGFGLILETTSTLNTYTFHRLTPKATEVTTVAGISSNVTTVAGISSNVTTVAGISSNVTAVAGKTTEITRLGTTDAVADMALLGTTDAVADMNTLGTSSNVTNMNTLAGISSNITTVAGISSNVTTVAGNNSNVTTVAGAITNVNNVGGSIASVNTAASNLSSINNFGDKYQVASSNPSTDGGGNALAEGDLYFNTTANELKVYNGGAWQGGVTASGNFASTTGNTFTGDNLFNDNVKAKFGTASDLEIFHNSITSTINNNTGMLGIISDTILFKTNTGNESLANFNANGAIELFYDNSKKFETTSGGISVTGNVTVTGTVDGVDIAALNSTVSGITSNATHSGEVTGSTALTIADNVVDEANLKVSNSPTDGYFLSAQSGNTGGLTWAEVSAGVTSDSDGNTSGGTNAGDSITSGVQNTAFGKNALTTLTTTSMNTAVGFNALYANTSANCTAVGDHALGSNTSGAQNTAVGSNSLAANTTGSNNVAVGHQAYKLNTTGQKGVAIGSQSLEANTTGNYNVAIGWQTLEDNTTGSGNVAIGYHALTKQTTADHNTAVGKDSLKANTTGSTNTAVGASAGVSLTTGVNNVAIGAYAAQLLTTASSNVAVGNATLGATGSTAVTGGNNTAVGNAALLSITTGHSNVAVGANALDANTTGQQNNAFGFEALTANTTGSYHVAVGEKSLGANTTGSDNTGCGHRTLQLNTTGESNTAVGANALDANTTANFGVAVGVNALGANTTGANNTSVGYAAGDIITTGPNNIIIGSNSDPSSASADSQIVIGVSLTGKGNSTAFIGGSLGAYNGANGTAWTTTSDERIKKNIVDNNSGLNILNQIQIRNFEYKTEDEIIKDSPELKDVVESAVVEKEGLQLGVIAQELEKVLPDCVTTQSTGIKTVDSDNLTWYLINAVKELSAKVTALEAG